MSAAYQCAIVNRWHRRRPIHNVSKNSENVSSFAVRRRHRRRRSAQCFRNSFRNKSISMYFFSMHRQSTHHFMFRVSTAEH